MRCIPLRLPPGADLRRALESRAAEGEALHAFVVAGIGSLSGTLTPDGSASTD